MAEPRQDIFTEKASAKLRNPVELDAYLRVANPRVWVILAACIALLASLLAWGVFGTVTTRVAATATRLDSDAVCFLSADHAAKIKVGNSATVGDETMEVASISAVPVSRAEVHDMVGSDYLESTLVEGDWTYVVRLSGGGVERLAKGVPLETSITTERIAPIKLLFGGNV